MGWPFFSWMFGFFLRPFLRDGTLGLIACVCFALLGTEVWQSWSVYDDNIRQADVMTSATARSMAEQAETTIQTADTIAASLVERVEAEGTGPDALARFYRLMTSLAAALPAVHEMGITDSHGNAIVKSLVPDPSGLNYADREYFRFHATHADRGPFIGARIKSKIDGSFNITVTRRINNADGSFGGVVVASISLKYFQQLFDQMQSRAGGIIALLSDNDTILARSPRIVAAAAEPLVSGALRRRVIGHLPSDSLSYTSAVDGVSRRGSYQHLAQFPLLTLVALSDWDLHSGWRAELRWHLVTFFSVMVVIIILGWRVIKANRVLNAEARQDGLTGLANRRSFGMAIEQEFRRAKRSEEPLSLIMIDIDHFKNYNDCYGHPRGDECLRSVARAIQGCLRRAGDLAARYGGEEIAVILPATDAMRAKAVAEKMQRAVHDLVLSHANSLHSIVTFSAGVATCVPAHDVEGWQALVRDADSALYAAKANGRNRVELYPPSVPIHVPHDPVPAIS